METKRGCPYRCNFCAHRELEKNSVVFADLQRVFAELDLFKEKQVGRINVLDPIFNVGPDYLEVVRYMNQIDLASEVTFQIRGELLDGPKGKEFLDLVQKINANFEFGLQTIHPAEYQAINRPNDLGKMSRVLTDMRVRGISYEVSLISGLPHQTEQSLHESQQFLLDHGCKPENIKVFPLMLLRGTELYEQAQKDGAL